MKKRISLIITATLVILSTGCDSLLDINPINTIDADKSLKTSKDVEALMVSAYTSLGDGDLFGGNLLRDSELLADDGEVYWDGTFAEPRQIWNKDILITNSQVEDTWLDAYRTINMCNTVLANLSLVSPNRVDRIEGEARFIRGVVYFELIKVFAKTWTDTDGSPETNPGVPIVTEPNSTELIGRSSVADVYDLIISDLTNAKSLLPATNSFFATTYSASGMLARVYMMQNDYANAVIETNAVINSGEFSLLPDYSSNFNNTARSSTDRDANQNATVEDVFSIQVTNQAGVNNMVTFFATSDFGGRGDIYIEPMHFDLYEEGDERLNLFYDDERTGKWINQFGNVNILRLAEMYLTRAEAKLRLNPALTVNTPAADEPIDDVNRIRQRVGLDPLITIDLDAILLERHLELAFEGQLLHDVKRTQSSVGSMPYNDPKLIYPIPNRERIINPNLQQNTGYGSE